MKNRKYIKIWLSYRDYFAPLSYDQIGQLIMALLDFADSGTEPDILSMDR